MPNWMSLRSASWFLHLRGNQHGYYELAILDWREELRECRELSAQFGFKMTMRSGDVVQVAIARLAGADAFVTCDPVF